uniref:Uncharacterized protein n=1 Tax=Rhizophora mucronata TaxID=61149 RepID=A0A2P2NU11_RHIMU
MAVQPIGQATKQLKNPESIRQEKRNKKYHITRNYDTQIKAPQLVFAHHE